MDRLVSSAVTVGKVILAACVGVWVSRHFAHKDKSLKALSHISARICLPCLLFSHLATGISWEILGKYYWACILPLIPMFIGWSSSLLFRLFIPHEMHGLLQLACSFQNVISFGLGIVMNLNLPWWSEAVKKQAQSYVVLYNVVHSLFLWSVGTMIIEKCAVDLEEKKEASTWTELSPGVLAVGANTALDNRGEAQRGGADHSSEGAEVRYQPAQRLEDYRPQPTLASNAGTVRAKRKPTAETTWMEYICIQLSYLATEQLFATFLGLLVALVPPFDLLIKNPLGELILGGISLLAPGTVPLQLLLLGVNVTATGDDAAQLTTPFLFCVILLRLVFIPLVCFGIVHLLIVSSLMPYDAPFVFMMLLLTCAPTAINTSIICSLYSYKVKEYTRLLLCMYVTCIFTTTMWLAVYTRYVESS